MTVEQVKSAKRLNEPVAEVLEFWKFPGVKWWF